VAHSYKHIRVAHLLLQCIDFAHCHQVAQVVCQAEVVLVVVEVHLYLRIWCVTVDSLGFRLGKEGSCPFGFDESLPGVCLSPPTSCYTQEIQLLTSSLLRLHQQKNIPFGRNGSVRVDALRQSRQRHPGGGLLRARRQYNVSRCISPSNHCFTVSSRSVGLLF
jgi:hypothetical protein